MDEWSTATAEPVGDFAADPFEVADLQPAEATLVRRGSVVLDGRREPVRVTSRIAIDGGRLDPGLFQEVTLENRSDVPIAARLGLEWSTMLLGGGGNPAAWWDVAGELTTHDASRSSTGVERLLAGNDHVGLAIATEVSPPADAWIAPIETISNSEAGFERVYQGSALLLSWAIELAPAASFTARIAHRVTVARDRAAEEGLPVPTD
jgi:alpha-amylase